MAARLAIIFLMLFSSWIDGIVIVVQALQLVLRVELGDHIAGFTWTPGLASAAAPG